ncbi:hypothetical protein BZG36_05015 [Bifiguratus adelaidae]|uniref:Uncharacterized protein n=1 Tax=Bifiguratus adelaidae TaxID=1938954 RepID=A0A261XU50_9FUNG|nr:hypothetical protein BZG36_05015 [Bifiguratus adelaidae]
MYYEHPSEGKYEVEVRAGDRLSGHKYAVELETKSSALHVPPINTSFHPSPSSSQTSLVVIPNHHAPASPHSPITPTYAMPSSSNPYYPPPPYGHSAAKLPLVQAARPAGSRRRRPAQVACMAIWWILLIIIGFVLYHKSTTLVANMASAGCPDSCLACYNYFPYPTLSSSCSSDVMQSCGATWACGSGTSAPDYKLAGFVLMLFGGIGLAFQAFLLACNVTIGQCCGDCCHDCLRCCFICDE